MSRGQWVDGAQAGLLERPLTNNTLDPPPPPTTHPNSLLYQMNTKYINNSSTSDGLSCL